MENVENERCATIAVRLRTTGFDSHLTALSQKHVRGVLQTILRHRINVVYFHFFRYTR